MNKAILVGNVGSDPKSGHTGSGVAWAQISLATSEKWKDKQGERQEKTSWHRIKFWGRQAEIVAQYVKRGSKLLVEGRIEYGEYTNKDDEVVKTTEIVASSMEFLSPKGDAAPSAAQDQEDTDVPF